MAKKTKEDETPLVLFYETGLCSRKIQPKKGRIIGFKIGEDVFSFSTDFLSFEEAEKKKSKLLDFGKKTYFSAVIPGEEHIQKLMEKLEDINVCIRMLPKNNKFEEWKDFVVWSNKAAASDYRFTFNLQNGKRKSTFLLKEARVVWRLFDTGKVINRP